MDRYVNQFALCRPSKRACFLEPLNVQTQTVSNRRNINKMLSRRIHSTSFDLIRLPKPSTFKNLSFTISSLLLEIQDAELPQSLDVVLMCSPQSDHRQWAEAA